MALEKRAPDLIRNRNPQIPYPNNAKLRFRPYQKLAPYQRR